MRKTNNILNNIYFSNHKSYFSTTILKNSLFKTSCYLLVSLLIMLLLITLNTYKNNLSLTNAETYARWDSQHYVNIALSKYKKILPQQCHDIKKKSPANPKINSPSLINTNGNCSNNASWFPLYPLLISAASTIFHASVLNSGFYLANIFFFLNILLLIFYYKQQQNTTPSFLMILSACCFLGSIYYHAVFPISLTIFCTLIYLGELLKKQYLLSSIFGFLAGMAYPPMFSLSIISAFFLIVKRNSIAKLSSKELFVIICPSLGFITAVMYIGLHTGTWNAFFLAQKQFPEHQFNFIKSFVTVFLLIFNEHSNAKMIGIHSLITLLFVSLLALKSIQNKDFFQEQKNKAPSLLIIYSVIIYMIPLIITNFPAAASRRESLLLPAILLFDTLSLKIRILFTIMFCYLFYQMSDLFFLAILI